MRSWLALCLLLALATPALAVESGQDTCVVNGAVHADCRGGPPATTGSLMCLEGRDGGQTLQGGTAAGEDLILESTAHATKGEIAIGQEPTNPILVVDEATGRVGIAKSSASLEAVLDIYLGGRCDNGDPCDGDGDCTGTCNNPLPVMILRNHGEVAGGGVILTFIADPTTGLSGNTKRMADIRAITTVADPSPMESMLQFFTNEGDLLREHLRISSKGTLGVNASTESMITATGTLMLRDGSATSTEPVRIDWYDAECVDNDLNARIEVSCTDTGSGTEDCDIVIQAQEGGAAPETRFRIDADGGVTIGSVNTDTITFTTDGTAAGEINMTPLATPSANEALQIDSTGGLLRDGKRAVEPGDADDDIPLWSTSSGQYEDCELSPDFVTGGSPCMVQMATSFSEFSTCVGDISTEFCFQTDFGNRELDMGAVQRLEQPHATDDGCDADTDCNAGFVCGSGTCGSAATNTGERCAVDADCPSGGVGGCEGNRCEPADLGVMQVQVTENVVARGVGGRAERYVPGPFRHRIGGTELTNNFLYHGEGGCSTTTTTACDEDSDCPATETCGCSAADICRGGLCTGTAPNGTCTLQPNSFMLTYFLALTSSTALPFAFELDVYDFNVTAGTVTLARAATPTNARFGQAAVFYVTNNAFINEGAGDVVFDFAEMGGAPAYFTTSSSCANNQAGKLGGSTRRAATGVSAPPGASCTNGSDGQASQLSTLDYRYTGLVLPMGAGGGMIPGTNETAATTLSVDTNGVLFAGGGGGSAGSCPTTGCTSVPGNGGYGGGVLVLEVGNEFRCADGGDGDAEFDFHGESPTANDGGAGGGGGGLSVYARRLGSYTDCEIDNTGGTGDTSSGTCCDSGDGGDGSNYIVEVPQ